MPEKVPFDYTNSSIPKSILRLALPSMGASFFSSIYNLIDTFWIGHLGPDQVAGVTLAMMIFFMVVSLTICSELRQSY
jgi:Na+-driven multidrug efflux pump